MMLLRKQLSLDRETQKTLTDSLVVSNAEAELFRRKYSELQLRMDALGVESVSKDRAKLEQRLLKAVSDLQLMNKEKEAYREQLLKLSETMLRYVKSTESADPQARMEVEAQLRGTNQLLAAKDENPPDEVAVPDLMDGKVLSVKEEWSLVVGNLGARQGVKLGMPLRVVRAGKTDRNPAGGGCAREDQRRGYSGIGFGESENKSRRSPPGGCAPECEFKINGS